MLLSTIPKKILRSKIEKYKRKKPSCLSARLKFKTYIKFSAKIFSVDNGKDYATIATTNRQKFGGISKLILIIGASKQVIYTYMKIICDSFQIIYGGVHFSFRPIVKVTAGKWHLSCNLTIRSLFFVCQFL